MADEDAFFVVVGVDEPTCDAGAAAIPGLSVEDVDSVDLDLGLIHFGVVTCGGRNVDVGFALLLKFYNALDT